MKNAATIVGENDEAEQDLEGSGRHGEKVAGGGLGQVVLQEGEPALRAGSVPWPSHLVRNGAIGHVYTEQSQLRLNPRCAPGGVLAAHASDQRDDLSTELGPTALGSPRFPPPELPEYLPVTCPPETAPGRMLESRPWIVAGRRQVHGQETPHR